MRVELPNTSIREISKTLLRLREEGGVVALGRVLTLLISTDEAHEEAAIDAANVASREHPMRVIVVREDPRLGADKLHAEIRVGGDAGASDVVAIRGGKTISAYPDALVTGLLLPDAPVVAWWASAPVANVSNAALGRIAQRRIIDTSLAPEPISAMFRSAKDYAPGDTDFAWTRLTAWRAQLATVLDLPPHLPIRAIEVEGDPSASSVYMMAAWLQQQLGVAANINATEDADELSVGESGLHAVRLIRDDGTIVLERVNGDELELRIPSGPTHRIAFPHRVLRAVLAEELRGLGPDRMYGEVVTEGIYSLGR